MFHFLKECDFERKIITECFFLFAASRARPSCSEQYPTFPNTRSFRLNATDGIDHLKIECDDGFIQKEPTEQAVMTCKNGIWHGSMIPSCESNFKIKDFFFRSLIYVLIIQEFIARYQLKWTMQFGNIKTRTTAN